jgi:hypothetical protein
VDKREINKEINRTRNIRGMMSGNMYERRIGKLNEIKDEYVNEEKVGRKGERLDG